MPEGEGNLRSQKNDDVIGLLPCWRDDIRGALSAGRSEQPERNNLEQSLSRIFIYSLSRESRKTVLLWTKWILVREDLSLNIFLIQLASHDPRPGIANFSIPNVRLAERYE